MDLRLLTSFFGVAVFVVCCDFCLFVFVVYLSLGRSTRKRRMGKENGMEGEVKDKGIEREMNKGEEKAGTRTGNLTKREKNN